MHYKWIYNTQTTEPEVFSNVKNVAVSDVVTNLLISRGITTQEEAFRFLNPGDIDYISSDVFPDMEKSVARIHKAIANQEQIYIYGDFDSDGVTSTSLIYKTLKHLGAKVDYYIPDRSDEGHGLNKSALIKLISAKQTKLLITVDCGISNLAEVKLAENFGTNVIITDHHEPLEEVPPAFAIINPKLIDNKQLYSLAGVGVAFKLAHALLKSCNKEEFIKKILHLVAIGTVGDVVPLLHENRTLVYKGLELINSETPACIKQIMKRAGFKEDKKITSSVLAFTIVPRINAIGRLSEAINAVEFLVTEDPDKLEELEAMLDKNNKERQNICDETFKQVEEKIANGEIDLVKDKAILLGDTRWHPGIIGLVASKLVEKYYRPALLFNIDERKNEARCSARCIDGFNLFEALSNFSEYFVQFGGHSLAAGFSASLEKIGFDKLKKMLLTHINHNLDTELLKPELIIDLDLKPEELNVNLLDELDKLAPYGEMNAYPIFSMSNLTFKSSSVMGQKKNHLKLFFEDEYKQKLEAVWWNKNHVPIVPNEKVNIAFVPSINNYNNQTTIQLVLKDIQSIFSAEAPDLFEISANNARIDWIDHRQDSGLKKEFLEYIKSWGDDAIIFAESAKAQEILNNAPALKSISSDRLTITPAKCLVLLDFPSDDMSFVEIIKKCSPSEVHLFGLIPHIDEIELIKKASGMFKYAHNELNGELNINRVACSLAISSDLMFSCAELLANAGIIKIKEVKGQLMNIEFIGAANLTAIQELPAYHYFLNTISEFIDTKNEYKTMDLELIKETLDNLDTFHSLT